MSCCMAVSLLVLCGWVTRCRFERACAARGVPRRHTAADEARVEAALDERLRHVAPDVEAPGAIHGHRFVGLQLGDPLLDTIRIVPGCTRHQIYVARHVVTLPRVDNLHA